jgi:exosortase family protein XrtF
MENTPANAQPDARKIILFFAKICFLYLAWYFIFEFWILPHTDIHRIFTTWTAKLAGWVLNLFHFVPVEVRPNLAADNFAIFHALTGRKLVNVGHGCNALTLMVLFSGFILAFPAAIIQKVKFLATGILIIFILNILRVVALTGMWVYNAKWVDFNHKYAFTTFMYLVIMGMWLYWIRGLQLEKVKPQQ